MKFSLRFLIATVIFATIFIVASLTETKVNAYATGAPAAATGSPGDGTNCTACHSGTPATVAGLITSTIPAEGYIAGQIYTITAKLTDATVIKFGFEISPQNTSGALKGTLLRTDITRTQLLNAGKYITHTSSGTSGAGAITWSFNWKAPATGSGTVTFYGAFNFTNSNNSDLGDHIKLSQLSVSENLTAAVDMIADAKQLKIWPNPVESFAHISIPDVATQVTVQLFNTSGQLILETEKNPSDLTLDLSGYSAGVYFMSVTSKENSFSQRLIKL